MLQLGPATSIGAQGRLAAAIIGLRAGPLLVASIYLDPDPGGKQLNDARICKLAAWLRRSATEPVWWRAWDAEPQELNEGPLTSALRGRTVAPNSPTCYPTGARPPTLAWAIIGPRPGSR